MKNNKSQSFMAVLAIMMVYLISGLGPLENPAIASCQAAWPNESIVSIQQLTTIYSLVSVPVMLFVAPFVGKKIPYKTAIVCGAAFISIGGLLPIFVHPSWMFIIGCRVLLGVGNGLIGPRNALLAATVSPDKYGKLVGYGNTMMFAIGIIGGPLVGALVGISWSAAFWINIVAIPTLVLLLVFLKEPEKQETAEAAAEKSGEKVGLSGWIWVYAFINILLTGTVNPLVLGMSNQFITYNLGTTALAGIVISLYSVGAAAGGVVLAPISRLFKQHTLVASMLGIGICVGIVGLIPSNLIVAIVGTLFTGIFAAVALTTFQIKLTEICMPSRLSFASTVLVACGFLGIYISSYYISAADAILHRNTIYDSANLATFVVWAVLALILILGSKSINRTAEKVRALKENV